MQKAKVKMQNDKAKFKVAEFRNGRYFNQEIWKFYAENKREFPWRQTQNPYRILVSEVMLQQTQTARVVPFYKNFLSQFPNFQALAAASPREVLSAWQGLGYNRRALYLKKAAEMVVKNYGGKLPKNPDELVKLPGVGRNTAGAVCAYAFNLPVPFIETNIRKTFIRFFFSPSSSPSKRGREAPLPLLRGGEEGSSLVRDSEILSIIEKTIDRENPREWYYAVVDYGSHLGKTTRGMNAKSAHYAKQKPFEGSRREWRGKILRRILQKGETSERDMAENFFMPREMAQEIFSKLIDEKIIKKGSSGTFLLVE